MTEKAPRVFTDIWRARLSESASGGKNSMYGKQHTEETKEKIMKGR